MLQKLGQNCSLFFFLFLFREPPCSGVQFEIPWLDTMNQTIYCQDALQALTISWASSVPNYEQKLFCRDIFSKIKGHFLNQNVLLFLTVLCAAQYWMASSKNLIWRSRIASIAAKGNQSNLGKFCSSSKRSPQKLRIEMYWWLLPVVELTGAEIIENIMRKQTGWEKSGRNIFKWTGPTVVYHYNLLSDRSC